MEFLQYACVIGTGATAAMDAWGFARKPLLGLPPPDYGLVGRWIGHMGRGRFRHASIATAPRVHGERLIGWAAHYLIGVTFAALLLAIWGTAWVEQPTLGPASLVGIGTVAAPFLLMQPAMGAGIAARRAPRPGAARLQSLVTHAVFGFGLFASAWIATALGLV